MNENNKIVKNL